MLKNYLKEKAFWQRYTDDDLTNNDIDEINHNLQEFARVLLNIHKGIHQQPYRGKGDSNG